jgi:plasmid maintenance system antidote protein VapI
MGLTERLREAIRTSGESFNAISRATGVAVPVISRFARRERSLKIETADRLAAYFGLELVPQQKTKSRVTRGRT